MTFRAAQSFGAVGRATLRAEPSGNARCPAERPRTAASYPGHPQAATAISAVLDYAMAAARAVSARETNA